MAPRFPSEPPRFITAGNPGPFTLEGTRTYLVGHRQVAVIDPGPDLQDHVRALAELVGAAELVSIVLTHGHEDHAGAARALAALVRADVYGPAGVDTVERPLADGSRVETDAGALVAVSTPGHTADHLCYHWPERRALFAGDLLLGHGDTTWVADYPDCVADYLSSLARLRGLDLAAIYPAHGPPLDDPHAALDRFERHRRGRITQVERALAGRPSSSMSDLLDAVYGAALPSEMRAAASRSLAALVEHVRKTTGAASPTSRSS